MRTASLLRNICDAVGDECAARIVEYLLENHPEMVRTCESCGNPFPGRKNAKTCGDACRKRLERE